MVLVCPVICQNHAIKGYSIIMGSSSSRLVIIGTVVVEI